MNGWKSTPGEKAVNTYGEGVWLPEETLNAFREYLFGIKGPLTTPVGGGIRSINVALRQELDLYACVRPVQYFEGVPSPVKRPEDVDMIIFRENTEDIYAGIEYKAGSEGRDKLRKFLIEELGVTAIRFPDTVGPRRQAGQPRRHRASRSRRHSVRHRQRHARAWPWCTRATS